MPRKQATFRALRQRLLARASVLALRPRGWASGLLAVGLIGAPVSALAGETIDLADGAELTLQGAGSSVSGAGDVNGDGIDDLIIGALNASPNGRTYAGASYVVFGSDQGLPAIIDLATDADLIIEGAAGDYSGRSVSGAGDVNGDGIDDLIVGAPGADPNDRENAGTSYVILGSDQGFPATIDLADGADVVIQGAARRDGSGGSVSGAGDVNGDGIDDLIIGAPGVDSDSFSYSGASYVVFGTDQGFPPTIDLADPVDGVLTIQGAADEDSGGSVSGAGDVNGDGIDDLIIGAREAAPNGRERAGASYVVLGSMGLSGTIDLATGADVAIQGAFDYDRSGNPVDGAGDVNGDGIDDLIIGAQFAGGYAGRSFVIFGTDQGFPATIDLASEADLTIRGAASEDYAGNSVSGAGDVNGDSIDDLIIGAYRASPNGRELAGASYVILGSDRGLPPIIDLADGVDLIIEGAAADDQSSSSVSGAGDVNGDGIDDLIIGADPNRRDDAGASYVVFGGPAAAIERLIARVEAAELPGRLENNLTRTLSKSLENVTEDKITRAAFRLRAFIDKVRRNRGTRIDRADADAWIADARAIIDTLQAQRSPAAGPRALSAMVPAP